MSLAIPTLARRPRPHRRRTLLSPAPPRGGVRRIVLRFEWLEDRTVLSTFTVTDIGDSGPGSLRQAILDSNAATGATNAIDFKISGSGVQTIELVSPLPAITRAVLIDGTSQPGFAGTPLIELDGSQAGTADGLTITGSDATVRGLDIGGFGQGAGIHITGGGATGDWIYGCFLGTDPTGTQADPNDDGVEIDAGAADNLVGTNGDGENDTAQRNLLSGNLFAGVWITGQGTSNNAVAGNFIGTDITGSVALNNGTQPVTDALGYVFGGGVAISAGASGNRIGTDGKSVDDAGERNVIGGSGDDGVDIYGTGTDGNVVAGNFIGTDVTGTVSLGIIQDGVFLAEGASSNWIGVNPLGGTATQDEGNVIPGNDIDGVQIASESDGNTIAGNKIGTDASGTVVLYNPTYGRFNYGVEVDTTCVGNTIGGLASGAGNLISGNWTGIGVSGNANLIEGNKIGTDITGTMALGNGYWGVSLQEGADNTVGGTTARAGNLISGNNQGGVAIHGIGSVGEVVQGNLIGTDVTGTEALGNAYSGVYVGDWGVSGDAASNVTIGGTTAGAGNVISSNGNWGVWITGAGTTGVVVQGNSIGTDATETVALGNAIAGIRLDSGASGNTIGGVTAAAGNVISGNAQGGVVITGQGTIGNQVAGNDIGTDRTGTSILPNGGPGIVVEWGACNNTIGGSTAAAGNLITNNDGPGVVVGNSPDDTTVGDEVIANRIFANDASPTPSPAGAIQFQGSSYVNLPNGLVDGTEPNETLEAWFKTTGGGVILGYQSAPDGGAAPTGWDPELYVGWDGRLYGGAYDTQTSSLDQVISNNTVDDGRWHNVALVIDGDAGTMTLYLDGQLVGSVSGSPQYLVSSYDQIGNGFASGWPATPGGWYGFVGEIDDVRVWNEARSPGEIVQDMTTAPSGTDPALDAYYPLDEGQGTIAYDHSPDHNNGTLEGTGGDLPTWVSGSGQAIDLGDDGITENADVPRQGPDNFQNEPIFFPVAGGGLEGWLSGSAPDTTFRIDVYASAGYGPGGAGQAQDYLGALDVTTDASGQVTFAVPFTAPAGLPDITATATDPVGNTSEVSALRRAVLQAPTQSLREVPGQPLILSAASGDGIALQDPDAGPFEPTWELTLSIAGGTLTLGSTAGLTGSGNGTGSISYAGTISALDAALASLTFTPVPGYHGDTTLSLAAESEGALSIQTQIPITDGVFTVTTTSDGGPGSLRQAILDSNTSIGGTNTINFDIAGPGVQTISPLSPLPPITTAVVIDGTTQPGYAGTPLIAFAGGSTGGGSPLSLSGQEVTIRGLALDSLAIDTAAEVLLTAVGEPQGLAMQLSLFDSQGQVLVESEGASSDDPADVIDEELAAGHYSLGVNPSGGQGTYTLTVMLSPATSPFQEITLNGIARVGIVAGDFNGDGRTDLAIVGYDPADGAGEVSMLLGNGDGTFDQPPVTYAAGLDPSAIVAGDFTGNGHLDLAVANAGSDDVSVLLGNGDGTFQPQVTYAVGSDPISIVAGDLADDGRLDLAVANEGSNTVSMLLGNGDGTFQPQISYAVATAPSSMVAGDFTGDGRLSLAVDDGAGVQILPGNGDGTFQAAGTVAAGVDGSLAAGDFNGDGRTDLAVDEGGGVQILLSDGHGTFQLGQFDAVGGYETTTTGITILAGDFNADGHLDLAIYLGQTVSVLLGDGDGTFQPAVTYQVESDPGSFAAGDFNGDGRLDLAVTDYGTSFFSPFVSSTVTVLLGNGDGTFQNGTLNAVGLVSDALTTGDFTSDGHLDLAVANLDSDTVSVLLGDGDGTFQPQVTYAVGEGPDAIVTGDFNGDGRLDLAVANEAGTVSVLLGNGDGTFQTQVTYAVGPDPQDLVAGDFTGDGHLDLAVVDQDGVQMLLGNGDGTFQPAETVAAGAYSLVAGDFNGDGKLDLAVLGFDQDIGGEVSLLLGRGDGTFQPPVTYVVGGAPSSLATGDFNGDGQLDLVALDGDASYSTVSVLLGNGDGTFQPPVLYPVGEIARSILVGDFTGDGRDDLATANQDGTISVLLSNGDGTFQPYVSTTEETPQALVDIAAGDFNGDGHLDLAGTVNDSGNYVPILLGSGDGTFASAGQFATTPHATPLVADVNGDGTDDVLVVDGSGDILYRQGIPGQPGSFLPPVTLNPGFPSRDIAWVPDTRDGPLLASVDAQDDAVSLYAWRDGAFVRVGSLATGALPAQVIAADLDGTGFDDLVVRNAGDGTLYVYVNAEETRSRAADAVFLTPRSLTVGAGISDVQAVDATGDGLLDLVVTNKLTGQVGILPNGGYDVFAPMEPYRAGTGLSAVDPAGVPEVTGADGTGGVAAGPLTPSGPNSLVTINPGTNTLDVLTGLGAGRFDNPVTIDTPSPALAIREADFNHDGETDLAVLTADGVSIYLGNGQGGFDPPDTYNAGTDPSGLTVADLNGNGQLDLLVGNAYGDVLILVGNGDGTFRPFEPVKAAVALAVADLTGNGALDFVYADQSLNQVSVVYGSTTQAVNNSQVVGDQATGVLAPGAVLLADLNGDGIPDLVVANSGGNNVLVYPGLGNGQFGPPVGGTAGFPVGTDPTGLTVADLNGQPDLLVADTGSNDVSVLLGQGSGSSWTMISGARVQTDAGPAAVAVGKLFGSALPALAVANSGADNVQVFPGVGGGFFNDQPTAVKTYPAGQAPSGLFLGDFNGSGTEIAALNAGSSTITVIGPAGQEQTVGAGGTEPTTGFAGDFLGDGFTDLVVGNTADGHLALLVGSATGLNLSQTISSPAVPEPTGLSFAGVSDGVLSFYASTAGVEAATALAFNLAPDAAPAASGAGPGSVPGSLPGSELAFGPVASAGSVLASATAGVFQQVAQLLSANGSTLSLVAPLFTVSVISGESEFGAASEGGVALLANFLPGTGPGAAGQGLRPGDADSSEDATDEPVPAEERTNETAAAPPALPVWDRVAMGLERAWELVRSEVLGRAGVADGDNPPPVAAPARPVSPTPAAVRPSSRPPVLERSRTIVPVTTPSGPTGSEAASAGVTDAALAELAAEGASEVEPSRPASAWWLERLAAGRGRLALPIATAAAMASAAAVARTIRFARNGPRFDRRLPRPDSS